MTALPLPPPAPRYSGPPLRTCHVFPGRRKRRGLPRPRPPGRRSRPRDRQPLLHPPELRLHTPVVRHSGILPRPDCPLRYHRKDSDLAPRTLRRALVWFPRSPAQTQPHRSHVVGHRPRLEAPASAVTARILNHARQGDIICLHDGRGTLKNPDVEATLEAVRRIIPELLDRGYHFETVSELLCPKN